MSDKMGNEVIFIVEEAPGGGYTARALGEHIFTEADSLEELRAKVQDAVACHYEVDRRPALIRLHFIREEIIMI